MTNDHYNASIALAPWLSAALEDPNVCAEMKKAIRDWLKTGQFTDSDSKSTLDCSGWFPLSIEPVYKGWYEFTEDESENSIISVYWNGREFELKCWPFQVELLDIKRFPNGMWRGSSRPSLAEISIDIRDL